MRTGQTVPETIDEYIAGFPKEVQAILVKIRMTIRKADKRIPLALISKIVKFRAKENLKKGRSKR